MLRFRHQVVRISLLLLGWVCVNLILNYKHVYGQLNEPKRLKIGASLGAGGLHSFVGPSLDLNYHKTYLRVSPGLFFYGIGITQKAGYWHKRNGRDKFPVIFSFYYLDDYFLSQVKRDLSKPNQRKDLKMLMVMMGAHMPFDRLDRHYWEIQTGLMYARQQYHDFEGIPVPTKHLFFPMIEFRIGGILQLHQNHTQKNK